MQERHKNKHQYFKEQAITTEKFVIPYIERYKTIDSNTSVLEIGCGTGGGLSPLLDKGCNVTGIDIREQSINTANELLNTHQNFPNLELIAEDIYKISDAYIKKFDIVIMRDVIEHITGQEYLMNYIKRFIKTGGVLFFAFPPWYNPFGGHQQIAHNKLLSMLPYFHLLPIPFYKGILRLFKEPSGTINELLAIKSTGISIERFNKIVKKCNYEVINNTYYFINPNYETKFGLKPRKQFRLISMIPYIRNYFITSVYYLIRLKNV